MQGLALGTSGSTWLSTGRSLIGPSKSTPGWDQAADRPLTTGA
jgi:hypothetical protein